jgi:hypothetical protein
MVTLLINMFLYWIGAFSKRESDSEDLRYPSAREPGVCSGGYPIPAMQHAQANCRDVNPPSKTWTSM